MAGRGVTVNAVAPGYIPSKLTDAMSEEAKQATLGQIPVGRLGTPEEVAAAVASWPARKPATSPARSWPLTAG